MTLVIPTPLQCIPSIERELGRRFWLKREDALDDLGCGHKLRKLDALLPNIQQAGASVLVTAGSLPSSQTAAVSLLAARQGLKAHVVYMGDIQEKPSELCGSYLVCCLAAPRLTWYPFRPWREVDAALAEVCAGERSAGEQPFVVPPGISEGGGLLGSIRLGEELAAQLPPGETHLVVATGSGGTALGIAIAGHAAGLPWTTHAACIASDAASTYERIADLARRHGVDTLPTVTDIALGDGYGRDDLELRRLARHIVLAHGLALDTTYMLKAYQAMHRLCETERIPSSAAIVLVHTGGNVGALCSNAQLAADAALVSPEWIGNRGSSCGANSN